LSPEHHFDISVSPGQPVKYSHKLLFALFEAVDAVLTREMASGESDCLLANNDCPPERRGLWPGLRRRAFLSHVNERAAHR